MPPPSICLITPGHISSCPRLVKEADALLEAGAEVSVVSATYFDPVVALDRRILQSARWKHVEVATHRGLVAAWRRLRSKSLRRSGLAPVNMNLDQAVRLLCPARSTLVQAAVATGADFFHAHCLGGLAAAAEAARHRGGAYGFDAEDDHETETDTVMNDPLERAAVATVLHAYLSRAQVLTAASPMIAGAYRERHGCEMQVVLNAFTCPSQPTAARAAGSFSPEHPAKLYWFSQTVGAGRGLEQMVDVVGRMKTPARLQLRGFVSANYRQKLAARAAAARVTLEFLDPGAPGQMVELAAEADVGLSLEQSYPPNRDICLTNKVFVYLAAGLPQFMSATRAQSAFAGEIGSAAVVGDLSDVAACALTLDRLLGESTRLAEARSQAKLMGDRFSWAVEKGKFLAAMQPVLSAGARA